MSRQHRAPMIAFVALALVCGAFFTVAAVRQGRISELVTAQDEYSYPGPPDVSDPVRLSVDLDGSVGTSGGAATLRIVPAVATSPVSPVTSSRPTNGRGTTPAQQQPAPKKSAPVNSTPPTSGPKKSAPKTSVPAAPAVAKPAPKQVRRSKQSTVVAPPARLVSARTPGRGPGPGTGTVPPGP